MVDAEIVQRPRVLGVDAQDVQKRVLGSTPVHLHHAVVAGLDRVPLQLAEAVAVMVRLTDRLQASRLIRLVLKGDPEHSPRHREARIEGYRSLEQAGGPGAIVEPVERPDRCRIQRESLDRRGRDTREREARPIRVQGLAERFPYAEGQSIDGRDDLVRTVDRLTEGPDEVCAASCPDRCGDDVPRAHTRDRTFHEGLEPVAHRDLTTDLPRDVRAGPQAHERERLGDLRPFDQVERARLGQVHAKSFGDDDGELLSGSLVELGHEDPRSFGRVVHTRGRGEIGARQCEHPGQPDRERRRDEPPTRPRVPMRAGRGPQ